MSKKVRDYLFISFIVVFVITTFFVSLYASGYKINFGWPPSFNRLLLKTGMLAVDTIPAGATVSLNGREQTQFALAPWKKETLTTAAKIKNLAPGEYDLVLEREGYWAFQKRINIYSGQTTFVEDINLFRKDLPLLLTSAETGELQLSRGRKYLYLSGAEKIINVKTGQERLLEKATVLSSPESSWQKNEEKLLLAGRLLDFNAAKDIDYRQLIGAGADYWYNDENTDRLYFRHENSLNYLNTNKNTVVRLLSGEDYLSYEPRGEDLFLVAAADGRIVLRKYSLPDRQTEQEISLPGVGTYRFVTDGRNRLALYDDQNSTLYLINPNDLGDTITIKNVISWQWLDEESLLYNNAWEIYFLNLNQKNASLITRVGEEIKKIIWNKNQKYLIFSSAGSLNALDLQTGTITTILQTKEIASPVLDDENDLLYFWAQIGQQAGIYQLLLQ
ncbi:TPA: hypothetical protein DCZ15_00500 [Candidatus Falkowbacteria bacterium]|nr:hypothetical protein [Candidatus Falkowbacteria bacterium]